jgi:hypothetical protein
LFRVEKWVHKKLKITISRTTSATLQIFFTSLNGFQILFVKKAGLINFGAKYWKKDFLTKFVSQLSILKNEMFYIG